MPTTLHTGSSNCTLSYNFYTVITLIGCEYNFSVPSNFAPSPLSTQVHTVWGINTKNQRSVGISGTRVLLGSQRYGGMACTPAWSAGISACKYISGKRKIRANVVLWVNGAGILLTEGIETGEVLKAFITSVLLVRPAFRRIPWMQRPGRKPGTRKTYCCKRICSKNI